MEKKQEELKGQEEEEEKQEEKANLDNWDGFIGSKFLKADDVIDKDHVFVCTGLEIDHENHQPVMKLESKDKDGKLFKSKLSLNVSNSVFAREHGCPTPKDLSGKKITFRKVEVYSPKAKHTVEGLRINTIE